MSVRVQVAIRVRPLNAKEKKRGEKCIIEMSPGVGQVRILPNSFNKSPKKFTFDHVFWSASKNKDFADQVDVFKKIGVSVLDDTFKGYNTCVFAYGQTSSGKSYTIVGSREKPGLVPRICSELFTRITNGPKDTTFSVETSMVEIYNEKVRDLFNPSNPNNVNGLKVRENAKLGPYVEGLENISCSSEKDIEMLIARGNKYRTIAETQMNKTSSRAHTIFTIMLNQVRKFIKGDKEVQLTRNSKINLIDLAGSERVAKTGATGIRFKEGTKINLSLNTLGNVITQLAKKSEVKKKGKRKKRKVFVSYRDSILTWLLKESLGGNASTIMISAISPAEYNYNETLSTLRYSDRAKAIKNKPKVNEDKNAKIIRELKDEIERLKLLLGNPNLENVKMLEKRNKELSDKLMESKNIIGRLEMTQKEKEERSNNITKTNVKHFENLGLGKFKEELKNSVPYIINLSEDEIMNENLLFFMKKNTITYIGSNRNKCEIIIKGIGINKEHGYIENKENICYIKPLNNSFIFVNGVRIINVTKITNLTRIGFGKTGMMIFKLINPLEESKSKLKSRNVNYEFARKEIMAKVAQKQIEHLQFHRDKELFVIFNELQNKRDKHARNKTKMKEQKELEINKRVEGIISDLTNQIESFKTKIFTLGEIKVKLNRVEHELDKIERSETQIKDKQVILKKLQKKKKKSKDTLEKISFVKKNITSLKAKLTSKKEHLKQLAIWNTKKNEFFKQNIENNHVEEKEIFSAIIESEEKNKNSSINMKDFKINQNFIKNQSSELFNLVKKKIETKILDIEKKITLMKEQLYEKSGKSITMTLSPNNILMSKVANSSELLAVIQDISTANEIVKELGKNIKFALKMMMKKKSVFIFIICINYTKKQISYLTSKIFTERLILMNEYYNEVKVIEEERKLNKSQLQMIVPFDEDVIQRSYNYLIGSNVEYSLDCLLDRPETIAYLDLSGERGNIIGIVKVIVSAVDGKSIKELNDKEKDFSFEIRIDSVYDIPTRCVRNSFIKLQIQLDNNKDYETFNTKTISFNNLKQNPVVKIDHSFMFESTVNKDFLDIITNKNIKVYFFGELMRFLDAENKEKNVISEDKNLWKKKFKEESVKSEKIKKVLKRSESQLSVFKKQIEDTENDLEVLLKDNEQISKEKEKAEKEKGEVKLKSKFALKVMKALVVHDKKKLEKVDEEKDDLEESVDELKEVNKMKSLEIKKKNEQIELLKRQIAMNEKKLKEKDKDIDRLMEINKQKVVEQSKKFKGEVKEVIEKKNNMITTLLRENQKLKKVSEDAEKTNILKKQSDIFENLISLRAKMKAYRKTKIEMQKKVMEVTKNLKEVKDKTK